MPIFRLFISVMRSFIKIQNNYCKAILGHGSHFLVLSLGVVNYERNYLHEWDF